MKHRSTFRKKDYPVSEIRRYLEPGPVALVSSAWKENTNIITMGWHMVLEFSPSLVACCISSANHSFEMIRRSQECVINVPTTDLVNKVRLSASATAPARRWTNSKRSGSRPHHITEGKNPHIKFGQYILDRKLVRRRWRAKRFALSI